MFASCQKLKGIKGIENFNTTLIENMANMFTGCEELEILDLTNFNTSNATNMEYMVANCNK